MSLNESKVLTAVKALVQVSEKSKTTENIIDKVDYVHLQICVKKIPLKSATIKLKLPHAIQPPGVEACLFVKDLNRYDRDYEPTVQHFKDFLRKQGIISVIDVVPLKSLKLEYKQFEAKRNLSNAYDIFLADARIIRLLPTILGKHFYGRRKAPVQVNLQAKDLVKEVEAAFHASRCAVSSVGSSSLATVGNVAMSPSDIADNILAAASKISTDIPGGISNIKQISIKTSLSVSIPIYMADGGPQDVTLPTKVRPAAVEAEEISTLLDAKVKVYPDGRIKIIKDGMEDVKEKPQRTQKVHKRPVQHRGISKPPRKNVARHKKTAGKQRKGKPQQRSNKTAQKKNTVDIKPPPAKKLRKK